MVNRPLTDRELNLLRRYASGSQIADIAADSHEDRQRLGQLLADLCSLNRNAARTLVQEADLARRNAAVAARPAPPATPRTRHTPATARPATRTAGSPPRPTVPPGPKPPAGPARSVPPPEPCPTPAAAARPPALHEAAEPIAVFGAHHCTACRYVGPAADHRAAPDCGPLVPVDVTVSRRQP